MSIVIGTHVVQVSRAEAFDLATVWKAERSLLRIDFRLRILSAHFRARVADVADPQILLIADDEQAELQLPVPRDATFQYLDQRESPPGEAGRVLVLLYPFVPDPDESDQLVLTELLDRRSQRLIHTPSSDRGREPLVHPARSS